MLNNVRTYIENLPDNSFAEYYSDYIQMVQDKNIDSEVRFLLNHNTLDIKSMQALVSMTYERMRNSENSKSPSAEV